MKIDSSCLKCKHLAPINDKKCVAFPDGIPEEIWTGKISHKKKHPDQKNDILFTPWE